MNNENKEFFNNDVEVNVGEEEIVLAPPTELIDEAKEIAQNTTDGEKFPFILQYDVNQKDDLQSMLQMVGAIVEDDDEEGHMLSTRMNMTQLAFIKRLDCVERVRTDEGINPFLAEEAVKLTLVQQDQQEDESLDGEEQEVITDIDDETLEVQTELVINRTTDASIEAVAVADEEQDNDGIAVASVTASARNSCSSCSCPTNVSMETAATISDESYTSGYICCPGTEQWFKFVATRTGRYTICTTGSLDTIGTLYDCCGNLITEVDDYAPCGKINFRIICNLTAESTYYVKVGISKGNVGSYTLRVTERVFANYVSINKNTITLEKGVTYELPVTPNYTYKGYNGAQRIPGLSVSINPSNANEKKIWWWEQYGDVLECSYGWDDDGDRYIHVKAIGKGIAKLYAEDWNENGKRDECTVSVTEGWLECQKPTIHSRESWGARSIVKNRLVERTKQPEMIIFHHTADKFESTDTSKIIAEIKETQDEHIDDEEKCDIAYHFIIDPAGGIWEGAEIDNYQRGHANGHFNDIGVVLLGDFESRLANLWSPNTLNEHQKSAMQLLSKWLCYKYDLPFDRVNRISPITTHKSASGGTECPGDKAESWIENDLENYITAWHP